MAGDQFDHGGEAFLQAPLAAFRRGRELGAVRHGDAKWPFLSIFRHADIKAALVDWETWSSNIPAVRDLLLGDASHMVQDDPPRHTHFRRCVAAALSPTSLAQRSIDVSSIVRARTRSLFEQQCDAVEEIGAQIALDLVSSLLGLPTGGSAYLRDWTNRFANEVGSEFVSTDDTILEAQRKAVASVHEEMSAYLADLTRSPQATGLVAESAGWPVTFQERIGLLKSIAFAGNHTTAHMTANAFWLFANNPAELKRLRSGEATITQAVEEAFRFKCVFRGITRLATREGMVCGVPFKAGDNLICWLTSANFDERRFERPDTFDIGRAGPSNLAFASGPHLCIGAHLARAQIAALIEMLRDQVAAIVVSDAKLSSDPWVDGFDKLVVGLEGSAI